jgi:hypothetical protein
MNDLDSAVEPWLLDPYADTSQCDVTSFRRWATKVAVLRSYLQHPTLPQPEDLTALYAGQEIPDWHIFVGRTMVPGHSHTFAGLGPIPPGAGGRVMGLTQVSWLLGHIAVVAIRVIRDSETGTGYFKMFKSHNRSDGILVAEVAPNAKQLPRLTMLPKLSPVKWESIVWYFSTNPLSPISDHVGELERGIRAALEERGEQYRELA